MPVTVANDCGSWMARFSVDTQTGIPKSMNMHGVFVPESSPVAIESCDVMDGRHSCVAWRCANIQATWKAYDGTLEPIQF